MNTKGMEIACAALAKLSGKSMEDVVDAELAKVLDKTIEYTPIAQAGSIRKRFATAQYTSQPATLYTPTTRAGMKWRARARRVGGGKLIYNLNNRYPLALWTAIQRARVKDLEKKLKAIGLARKSWWVIGKALGLPVRGGRFTSAVGIQSSDMTVSRKTTSEGLRISFANSQPTINIPKLKGAQKLQSSINGRAQYFTKNVEKGVFDSMAQIARAYPGLHLTGGK